MKEFETLGDWCKWLEKNFTNEIMIPSLPIIIRLDGNNFHNWTEGLRQPYDERLTDLMFDTTKFLVEETNAIVGYTQSDEITLILYSDSRKSQVYNAGKKQKILSKLTAKATNYFNTTRQLYLPNHNRIAIFDARIYQAPTLQDAVVQLLWRENDAIKNSISMLAQSLYSHKELQGLNSSQLIDKLLTDKQVNWHELPVKFKRGQYAKRTKKFIPFTTDEIERLPHKHEARTNPNLMVERSIIEQITYPPLNEADNLKDLIFNE